MLTGKIQTSWIQKLYFFGISTAAWVHLIHTSLVCTSFVIKNDIEYWLFFHSVHSHWHDHIRFQVSGQTLFIDHGGKGVLWNVIIIIKSGHGMKSWKVSYFCIKLEGLVWISEWFWVTFYVSLFRRNGMLPLYVIVGVFHNRSVAKTQHKERLKGLVVA